MGNPTLIKNLVAAATVEAYRIVKFGGTDLNVEHATADSDLSIGVTVELGADANERVDVVLAGLPEVEFGGNVTRGQKVTAGADGKAVAAAPAGGANAQIIGTAFESAVDGDIARIILSPSVMQG